MFQNINSYRFREKIEKGFLPLVVVLYMLRHPEKTLENTFVDSKRPKYNFCRSAKIIGRSYFIPLIWGGQGAHQT